MSKKETVFERYSEKAKRAIYNARYWAINQRSSSIDTGHLLIGTLEKEHVLFAILFPGTDFHSFHKSFNVEETPLLNLDFYYRKKSWVPLWLWNIMSEGREQYTKLFDIPLSDAAKRVLAYAERESSKEGENHIIDTEHLLLGIAIENAGSAASILKSFKIDVGAVRQAVATQTKSPRRLTFKLR